MNDDYGYGYGSMKDIYIILNPKSGSQYFGCMVILHVEVTNFQYCTANTLRRVGTSLLYNPIGIMGEKKLKRGKALRWGRSSLRRILVNFFFQD